jgi:hypothetical protein
VLQVWWLVPHLGLRHVFIVNGSSPCNYRLPNNHRGVYPAVASPNVNALRVRLAGDFEKRLRSRVSRRTDRYARRACPALISLGLAITNGLILALGISGYFIYPPERARVNQVSKNAQLGSPVQQLQIGIHPFNHR